MKRIPLTAEITAKIRAAFGEDANPADYAVYEAIALNQRPIRQKHPLFEGAIAQDSMLRELVSAIEAESAPLQLMHNTRTLPAGRIFAAKMHGTEVRSLFAISTKPENQSLLADIDAGIINQVSVNVLAKRLECSECGWDYLSDDATFMNVLNGECGNEHALRQDGVHIKMHGMDVLAEISLVGSGGADGARIVDKNNSAFASESFQRLAASGLAPAMLVASFNIQGTEDMDIQTLVADLTTVKAEKMSLEAQLTTATETIAERDTALEAANTTIVERDAAIVTLTAERDAALEAAKPDAPTEAVLAFVREVCERSLIASGEATPAVPESPEDQVAAIRAAQTKLSALIPVGGRANNATGDVEDHSQAVLGASAFRRAK